jgi:enterochelin esterase family protein
MVICPNLARAWLPIVLSILLGQPALAQKAPSFRSTEVHPDHTVTFRFFAPAANRVDLVLENRPDRLSMQKTQSGVWTVTTNPLRPEIYGYRFSIDGSPKTVHDPQSTKRRYGNDLLLIVGHPPEPWEDAGAPRGDVSSHQYTSAVVEGLPENRSDFVVYTPPGYDPKGKPYPVLYLLHVWGDRADSWNRFGQANLILDNLIAQGKARSMVVVMPLGYGEMKFADDYDLWSHPEAVDRNLRLFEKALISEVMPRVASMYNVRKDPEGTAILGASMGGLESMIIGLRHPDRFGWVGGESSALENLNFDGEIPSFTRISHKIQMVCGHNDELLDSNKRLVAWLRGRGQEVDLDVPEGTHSYIVWREGLVRFASAIF